MKYLLPLLICLLLAAAPAQAQDDGGDSAYSQQEDAVSVEDEAAVPEETEDAAADQNQTDMEQLRSRAADYKAQLAEEMPSTEEMKSLAEKYDVKTPSAEDVRNFGARHQGKFNKALDYAKQFQEFRREQADEYESGALAPAEE